MINLSGASPHADKWYAVHTQFIRGHAAIWIFQKMQGNYKHPSYLARIRIHFPHCWLSYGNMNLHIVCKNQSHVFLTHSQLNMAALSDNHKRRPALFNVRNWFQAITWVNDDLMFYEHTISRNWFQAITWVNDDLMFYEHTISRNRSRYNIIQSVIVS